METSHPASYTPAHIDNAKFLTSSIIKPHNRPSDSILESSSRSYSVEDREPLLNHSNTDDPTNSERNPAIQPHRKRFCNFGLPVIVSCRLFNTIFAVCTLYKANKEVGEGWNIQIHKLLFEFCFVIFVWNVLALVSSTFSCMFPLSPDHAKGGQKGNFRNILRTFFACTDAILALVTLVLLVVARHAMRPHWEGHFVGLTPPVVAMVASLTAVEFLVAIIQPFRFSEGMLFSISFWCGYRRY